MTTKIKCIGCRNYLLNGDDINYTIEFDVGIEEDKLGKLTTVEKGKYLVCKHCGRKVDVNKIRKDLYEILWNKLVERGFENDSKQKSKLSERVSGNKRRNSSKSSSKRKTKNKKIRNKS